jgi:pre-mRNA-splicing factor ATP-dependent RNA helicase DHX15/PRP43
LSADISIQDGDVNPFKNQAPFSANYKKILEQRKGLPVYQKMTEFLEVFSKNQITVMEGQTGSGKTTQIPQFVCYSDLPMLRGKMVACTQPRRVAAMSVAKRVADEMDGGSCFLLLTHDREGRERLTCVSPIG